MADECRCCSIAMSCCARLPAAVVAALLCLRRKLVARATPAASQCLLCAHDACGVVVLAVCNVCDACGEMLVMLAALLLRCCCCDACDACEAPAILPGVVAVLVLLTIMHRQTAGCCQKLLINSTNSLPPCESPQHSLTLQKPCTCPQHSLTKQFSCSVDELQALAEAQSPAAAAGHRQLLHRPYRAKRTGGGHGCKELVQAAGRQSLVHCVFLRVLRPSI